MFCVRCGIQNPSQAVYCFNCGARLAQADAPPLGQLMPTTNPYPTPPYQPAPAIFYPPPTIIPLDANARVVRYHPLAEGAFNLPSQIEIEPRAYYSYVNSQEQLVFVRRASFGRRIGAAVLDLLVLFVPYVCISSLFSGVLTSANLNTRTNTPPDPTASAWLLFLLMLVLFGYFYFTGISNGQSLGKRAMKIRVIRLDGSKPDPMTALLRYVAGYMLSTNILVIGLAAAVLGLVNNGTSATVIVGLLAFGWGFWWVAWDELRQGWHDKLARTLVVDSQETVEGVHFHRAALG